MASRWLEEGVVDKVKFVLGYEGNLHRSRPRIEVIMIEQGSNKDEGRIFIGMKVVGIRMVCRKIGKGILVAMNWRKKEYMEGDGSGERKNGFLINLG